MVVCAALGLLALFSCEKAPRQLPVSTQVPAQVLGVATVASLDGALGGAAAFANQIKPGAGAIIASPMVAVGLAQAVKATSLQGVDWDKPVHLVAVKGESLQPQFVLALTTKDAKAFKDGVGKDVAVAMRGAGALVGAKDDLALVEGWVYGALENHPPADLTFIAYPQHFQAAYGPQIDQGLTQLEAMVPAAQKQVMTMYRSMWENLAAEGERLEFSVGGSAEQARLVMGVRPKAGTKLAEFVAAQKPDDYALLAELPGGEAAPTVFVGMFAIGPYKDAFVSYFDSLAAVAPGVKAIMEPFKQLLSEAAYKMAGSMTAAAAGGRFVIVVDDPAAAQGVVKALAGFGQGKAVEMTLNGVTVRYGASHVDTHKGVEVVSLATTMTSQTPQTAALAQLGNQRLSVAAKDHRLYYTASPVDAKGVDPAIAAMIDADGTPSKVPSPQDLQDALARSRGRRESMFMRYDLGMILRPMLQQMRGNTLAPDAMVTPMPIEIGIGAASGALEMRFEVSAQSVQSMVRIASTVTVPVQAPAQP